MTSGCVSLYYQWRMKESANSADMTVAMLCSQVIYASFAIFWSFSHAVEKLTKQTYRNLECTIAIIVACAPALNTLYNGCIAERARRISALKAPNGGTEEAKANPLQQIRVTTHHYMEVDNNHKRTPGYQADITGNMDRMDWDSDSIA